MRLALLAVVALAAPLTAADPPNVVVILADDLGTGDVRALNPAGKIATPHLDKLAAAGLVFTDAHTPSGVCSPTRYGLLTGRYAWRSRLKSGVLGGLSPRLVEPDRLTLAALLQTRGYHTACVGKWHLGLDWVVKPGKAVTELNIEPREQVHNVDYAKPFAGGPTALGFDSYFGISASLDMVPYTFLRDDRVVALPTEDRNFPLTLGRDRGTTRLGPAAPGFEAADVLPALTKEAVGFINASARAKEPFFLYLPLTSPHTPVAPTKAWQGKSGLSPYADFVMQTDAAVGEVLKALDDRHLTDNTLVIFTSDNGCSPQADFPELKKLGHDPSAGFRGTKADIYEGGHRVPFIVRWPAMVKPGTSKQLVCLTDVYRTVADVAGVRAPAAAAEDSVSFEGVWRDTKNADVRQAIVHHSVNGSFAVREGKWKLCLCPGSGGWSAPRPGRDDASQLPAVQLFDLAADVAETTNVQDKHPAVVERLTKLLEKFVADGRSTPGKPQKNTAPVDIWKAGKEAQKPPAKKK